MFQKRKIFFRNLNHSVFTLLNDSQIPVFNSQYNHMFIMNESAFKRSAGLSILQTSWIIKVGIAIQNCTMLWNHANYDVLLYHIWKIRQIPLGRPKVRILNIFQTVWDSSIVQQQTCTTRHQHASSARPIQYRHNIQCLPCEFISNLAGPALAGSIIM